MESNSVCNHTSDKKADDRAAGVRYVYHQNNQTELDDTKSYYQLIVKITISEERRAKL